MFLWLTAFQNKTHSGSEWKTPFFKKNICEDTSETTYNLILWKYRFWKSCEVRQSTNVKRADTLFHVVASLTVRQVKMYIGILLEYKKNITTHLISSSSEINIYNICFTKTWSAMILEDTITLKHQLIALENLLITKTLHSSTWRDHKKKKKKENPKQLLTISLPMPRKSLGNGNLRKFMSSFYCWAKCHMV